LTAHPSGTATIVINLGSGPVAVILDVPPDHRVEDLLDEPVDRRPGDTVSVDVPALSVRCVVVITKGPDELR
jgi:hypothetical protein